jgi:hypothetical protein
VPAVHTLYPIVSTMIRHKRSNLATECKKLFDAAMLFPERDHHYATVRGSEKECIGADAAVEQWKRVMKKRVKRTLHSNGTVELSLIESEDEPESSSSQPSDVLGAAAYSAARLSANAGKHTSTDTVTGYDSGNGSNGIEEDYGWYSNDFDERYV